MIKTEKAIVEVAIDKIKLWKDNPRHNETAVPKLAAIIKARGQVTPIVVWRKTGVCYKGNTTLKAMRSLGNKTISVLYVDFPSETAAIAYGIADNKSSEWAEWDETILSKFLQMEDVVATGFTAAETESFFDIGGTVQLTTAIDDLLTIAGILKSEAIVRRSNYLTIADMANYFLVKNEGADGRIDPQLLSLTRNAALSEMHDPETNSVPVAPSLCGWVAVDKSIFEQIGKIVPFCSTTEQRLADVYFGEKMFATDGYTLIFRDYKGAAFAVTASSAKAIDVVLPKVKVATETAEYLKFTGDDFVLVVKKINSQIAPINKLIPSMARWFKGTDAIVGAMRALMPYINNETKNVFIDKSGLYFVNGARQFKVSVKTEFPTLTLLNSDAVMRCLEGMVEYAVAIDNKVAFMARNGSLSTLCLRCNIPTKPDFSKCVEVQVDAPSESVAFTHALVGGVLHGTVKGLSVESCKKFIAENFKCSLTKRKC
jgi:hypothetical protein